MVSERGGREGANERIEEVVGVSEVKRVES